MEACKYGVYVGRGDKLRVIKCDDMIRASGGGLETSDGRRWFVVSLHTTENEAIEARHRAENARCFCPTV